LQINSINLTELNQIRLSSRQINKEGGGTLVNWTHDALNQISTPYPINEDSVITKFTIANNRIIWICSLYLSKGTKTNFLEAMSNIQKIVPDYEWPNLLICGDWNIDISPKTELTIGSLPFKRYEMIKVIAKNMGLRIIHAGESRETRIIDYMMAGEALQIQDCNSIDPGELSDHNIITFKLICRNLGRKMNQIKVPNRKLAEAFTRNSLKKASDSESFLNLFHKRLNTVDYNIMKNVKKETI